MIDLLARHSVRLSVRLLHSLDEGEVPIAAIGTAGPLQTDPSSAVTGHVRDVPLQQSNDCREGYYSQFITSDILHEVRRFRNAEYTALTAYYQATSDTGER